MDVHRCIPLCDLSVCVYVCVYLPVCMSMCAVGRMVLGTGWCRTYLARRKMSSTWVMNDFVFF